MNDVLEEEETAKPKKKKVKRQSPEAWSNEKRIEIDTEELGLLGPAAASSDSTAAALADVGPDQSADIGPDPGSEAQQILDEHRQIDRIHQQTLDQINQQMDRLHLEASDSAGAYPKLQKKSLTLRLLEARTPIRRRWTGCGVCEALWQRRPATAR